MKPSLLNLPLNSAIMEIKKQRGEERNVCGTIFFFMGWFVKLGVLLFLGVK